MNEVKKSLDLTAAMEQCREERTKHLDCTLTFNVELFVPVCSYSDVEAVQQSIDCKIDSIDAHLVEYFSQLGFVVNDLSVAIAFGTYIKKFREGLSKHLDCTLDFKVELFVPVSSYSDVEDVKHSIDCQIDSIDAHLVEYFSQLGLVVNANEDIVPSWAICTRS